MQVSNEDKRRETVADWVTCIDCNWYDDVTQPDTFMMQFGDQYICALCAEERGLEPW